MDIEGFDNRHKILDGLGTFISIIGWIVLLFGALVTSFGIAHLLSGNGKEFLAGISLPSGFGLLLIGILIVAFGQMIKVFGMIESNTQRTFLLLRILVKSTEIRENPIPDDVLSENIDTFDRWIELAKLHNKSILYQVSRNDLYNEYFKKGLKPWDD